MSQKIIHIGVSNRHIHLSQSDADILFGKNHEFKVLKFLSQPWQYACAEVLTIQWPKKAIEKVRVLWPLRSQTQVEISITDSFVLGVQAPIRLSGDLKESSPITIVGPEGTVELSKWLIIAKRHLHMHTDEAKEFGLVNNQIITVKAGSSERSVIFDQVVVRVSDRYALDMHIDTDEANAAGIKNGDNWEIVS